MKWVVDHLWLFWTLWIAVLGIGYFAVFETIALVNGGQTFSAFIVKISMAWPPLIFLMGGLSFGLAVHFFWYWQNPIAKLGGGG
jgi:hypothetical protein